MTIDNDIPAIAVVPYGKWRGRKLAQMSLDDLEWPLGRPERLMNGTLRDLARDDHLITYPRKPVFWLPHFGIKAKVSVMIVEPDAIHGLHLKFARFLNWRFYKIMTKNAALLAQIKNGLFLYFGSTFLNNIDQIDTTKHKMASLVASARRNLEGHRLRHEIVDHIREARLDVDVMGRGYVPFEDKADGLAPYRYSVVIENIREKDYFSEKLVDACLCETVPIYWGVPNVEDYFDPRGIIICNSAAEIHAALKEMSVSDYESRLEWIKKNKQSAYGHVDYIKRAAETIRDSLD